jgi:hypothetical protein
VYPLVEAHEFAAHLQQQMIDEIESQAPQFLITVNVNTSWMASSEAARTIFDWVNRYAALHYRRVGLLDIQSQTKTVTTWGDGAQSTQPLSAAFVAVYERRAGGSR